MRLFIAEKPSLAQAIANGLGTGKKNDGYIYISSGEDIVTWCFGHILQQLNPDEYDKKYKSWNEEDLPIIPEKWKLKVTPSCKKQFEIVKKLISQADVIVNAGDPDREGQLLVDEVLDFLGNKKPVQRILLNALDDVSVQRALKDLRNNDDFIGMKNSALARSRADWLIGMNFTRAYTLKMRKAGYDSVMRIGRVKTPTMSLVVRRENEIKNFVPHDYFGIRVKWNHSNGEYDSIWQVPDNTEGLDSEKRLLKKDVAENILNKIHGQSGKIIKIEKKNGKSEQRLCYSLSTLQIEAGKKYGLSPQTVLDTMQSLYEKKLTTYPRSDCNYLPAAQYAEADVVLDSLKKIPVLSAIAEKADKSIKSKVWNDKKISAHHALIPTRVTPKFDSLSDIEQKLYVMVATAYIAQFYPPQTFLSTKITTSCDNEIFITNGKVVLEQGWKSLYSKDKNLEDKNDEEERELPPMSEGDNVAFVDGEVQTKTTKPPVRYTPATLLKAMKEIYNYVKDPALKNELKDCLGIGTEATRAGIIQDLQDSNLLSLQTAPDKKGKGKVLIPQESAYALFNVLPDTLTYPDSTAVWENMLDQIKDGKTTLDAFYAKQVAYINDAMKEASNVVVDTPKDLPTCPQCGNVLTRRKGSSGYFWGCSGFPNCKFTAPDKKGKPDFAAAEERKAMASREAVCPKCGKKLRQFNGKTGKFWSCEDRENCNAFFADYNNQPVIVKCPKCGKGFMSRWASKKKKGEYYWSCSERCGHFMDDKNGKPVERKK